MPRSFKQEFTIPLQQEITRKVFKATANAVRVATEETYIAIFEFWPTDTFWSAANHRIFLGGESFGGPIPPTRPEQPGVLSAASSANAAANLAKLAFIKPGQGVFIKNPVPYAADVGHSLGAGIMIYAEAAAIGSVRAADRILSEGDV